MHKRVVFRDKEYWLNDNGGMAICLSPIDHFSDTGELLADPFIDISYAVIEGNDIVRFGERIGSISELKDSDAKDTKTHS